MGLQEMEEIEEVTFWVKACFFFFFLRKKETDALKHIMRESYKDGLGE